VTTAYDLWNEERGAGTRAVIIVDREGVIRYRETYQPGTLPDPETILQAVADLNE
jgi:alkyl hydroperoxide reductase subunit AhpC